ncbi:serine hydrolase domain-containing protein [Fodinibius salsisoli]|uniref:Beta-lactamase family protein n=1 Tax=Fodinibius salsisoli TaxID=2820877 RepID=A0ABT3PNZ5_9BACT|nr:serine hydrolase domain-containing protein [Fodinibius salsisoli]MCW9707579.1 beta-lactamase family protein [Fodinibius salsisoli]
MIQHLNSYFLLFVLIILVLTACSAPPKPISNAKAQQLDSLFTHLHEHGMFNGAVAVVDSGKTIFKQGFGEANLEKETPFEPSTLMEIASLSKQFTAAAILHLEQQNKLSVKDDIKHYLPDQFPYEEIRIEHLLSHISGLPDYVQYFKEHWPRDQVATNKDIISYLIEQQPAPQFESGTKYDYSNTGYVILAEVVEAASRKPLDEYLTEILFEPFEFKDAGFFARAEVFQEDSYAPGFMWSADSCRYIRPENKPGKKYYQFLSGRLGPGRLSMSIDNLLKWDKLLYTDQFLTASSKEKMFTPVEFEGVETDYGFGWHNYTNEKEGKVSYHTGSWAGNLSYIKRFRDRKSTVVILNNTYQHEYMKLIRAKTDSIILGHSIKYPKPKLTEVLAKKDCQAGFDREQWMEEQNSSDYVYEDDNWDSLQNK